ncbi:MAG: 50S ribosomal protein L11 methyltransferase [Desulfotignum sp.]|nr:50S ribosomal protein L11 methyltransferase [Desulfotignum sp.]
MKPFDREAALAILDTAETRLTARAYVHQIADQMKLSAADAKTVLKTLVNHRDITYQDIFGSTCVIKSFQRPVQITDHFYLIPPDITGFKDRLDLHAIRLEPGISFGSGHHPTTRLCLAALEYLFYETRPENAMLKAAGADIGTGSGVLAIALCMAGISKCLAYDIDPNAVSDARKNIILNHLNDRISVLDHPLPETGPMLGIVCANLRTPTLETLAPTFRRRLIPGGTLIFSGIRPWEADALKACFNEYMLRTVWEKTEKNWVGLVLADH